jgi:2-dehydro-3-deoxyphosphogluconate aldolase/(4S)-4-hydroxy-2-oxoglutarate aldolase
MTQGVIEAITGGRVVSIVRERSASEARGEVIRLVKAGAQAIEVSLGTPDALDVVRWMVDEFAGHGVQCGVGTVLTVDQVHAAADIGARFVVSPIGSNTLVSAARGRGMVGVFGAMTPTECFAAVADGAEFVKLFPARAWTPNGLRDLLQAMPNLRIVPTGGLSLDDADSWLAAGAVALGLGGALRRESSAARLQAFYHRVRRTEIGP